MADVQASLKDWSTTASSNSPTDSTTIGAGLADNLQQIQATVRQDLASKGVDIASASTTDLGAVAGLMHDITGTTSITSFGTVAAGIWKLIKFEGVLTLTHNATSLILPGGANITTADGDTALMFSEGSGNWRCLNYQKANGLPAAAISTTSLSDVTAPTDWTPTDQSGAGLSITVNHAKYTKIGKAVTCIFSITYPATGDGSTAKISLPVTPVSLGGVSQIFAITLANAYNIVCRLDNTGAATMTFAAFGTTATPLANSAMTTNTLTSTFTYIAA